MNTQGFSADMVRLMVTLVLAVSSVAISYIMVAVKKYIRKKCENSDAIKFLEEAEFYLNNIEKYIKDVCISTYELFTKEYKKASADGKLTRAEIVSIKNVILTSVKAQLNIDAITVLDKVIPNLDDWILEKAESYLPGVKAIYKQLELMEKNGIVSIDANQISIKDISEVSKLNSKNNPTLD